jgi:peptidoglycan/LPS O-acetylase OafA/YrhL
VWLDRTTGLAAGLRCRGAVCRTRGGSTLSASQPPPPDRRGDRYTAERAARERRERERAAREGGQGPDGGRRQPWEQLSTRRHGDDTGENPGSDPGAGDPSRYDTPSGARSRYDPPPGKGGGTPRNDAPRYDPPPDKRGGTARNDEPRGPRYDPPRRNGGGTSRYDAPRGPRYDAPPGNGGAPRSDAPPGGDVPRGDRGADTRPRTRSDDRSPDRRRGGSPGPWAGEPRLDLPPAEARTGRGRPDRRGRGESPGKRHFDLPTVGRMPAAPSPRWDQDLSDPTELSGWRPSAPAPGPPPGPAPSMRGGPTAPPRSAPPRSVPPEPPEPPARGWSTPQAEPAAVRRTQVLDRGWHDEPETELEPGDDVPAPGRVTAPRTEPGPRPELPYVAGFDGLRAVALLAVLAFHHGFEAVRGGFLGISSFLTLSGFLLGTLALAEWSQDDRLNLGRLWERRARRILPPVILTVALVVVLQVTLRVGAGPGFRGDVLASLGQVLNWRFAFSGDGFASVLTDPSPVQHLWPLSVLVQLTVIVPLLFVGLMTLTGRRWRTAGPLFALAAGASFYLALRTARGSGNDGLAYYGTHTRAGELLVGIVLAYAVLSPAVRRVIETRQGIAVVRYGAPAALVGLLWLWHTTSLYSTNLFGGVTAVNALLTAFVVLAVTAPGPAAAVLGSLPLRTIGTISFAAYLLHWPLFLLIDDERLDLPSPLLFLVRLAATLLAAAAVTYGIERPLRDKIALPRPQLALALGLAAVVVAAAAFVLPEQPPPGVSLTVDDGSGAGDLDVVVPQGGDEELSVALVGGSLAGTMADGFTTWNDTYRDQQVRLHTHVAEDCPLGGAGPVRLAGATVGEDTACAGFAPRLPELLDSAAADVVVVMPGVGDLGEREIDRAWRHLGDPAYDAWLRERLADLDATLRAHADRVVWATSLHVRLTPRGDRGNDWTDVAANDPARVDRLNAIIRDVVGDREDGIVDLDAWAHRLPNGGEFGYAHRLEGRDLTPAGAAALVARLVPALTGEQPRATPDPAATTTTVAVDPAAPVDPAVPVDPAAPLD